jgi:hypothetical protein
VNIGRETPERTAGHSRRTSPPHTKLAGERLQLLTAAADLGVFTGKRRAPGGPAADRLAAGAVKHEVCSRRVPASVDHEVRRMIPKPLLIAGVIIDEMPHAPMMSPRKSAVIPR